jgi:hypothetical protein
MIWRGDNLIASNTILFLLFQVIQSSSSTSVCLTRGEWAAKGVARAAHTSWRLQTEVDTGTPKGANTGVSRGHL